MICDFGSPKKILVTPLNWGLGHATRSIPIIRELLAAGHEVHIGSDGGALKLLRDEFPAIPFITLPGYNINYAAKNLLLGLVFQWYKILRAVLLEQRMVRRFVKKKNIDIIISDNRLGCISRSTHNIIISHQLTMLTPLLVWTFLATQANLFWIRRFDEVWVPDSPPPDNLTGKMATASNLRNVHYIGILSRFQLLDLPIQRDFIAILSGPEPRRTNLERKILKQWQPIPHSLLIVRGIPDIDIALPALPPQISSVPYLTAQKLNEAICSSRYVISRTGYTTVMDMLTLQKKCILIPTPGQPEQEYLGRHLKKYTDFIINIESELDLNQCIAWLEES